MKGFLILVIVVLLGYAGVKGIEMFKTYGDFGERVEHELDFVSDSNTDSVKQDVIAEAKKFGIDVTPDDIHVSYEDTDQRTVAQGIVGSKLGAQFVNKSVAIEVNYIQRILYIPIHLTATRNKVRSVQAPRMEPSSEMKQYMDAVPQ